MQIRAERQAGARKEVHPPVPAYVQLLKMADPAYD